MTEQKTPYGFVLAGNAACYSRNANAYQKIRLTLEFLGGRLFVPKGKREWVPEDFRGHAGVEELPVRGDGRFGLTLFRMMRAAGRRAEVLVCAPSNEPSFLACLLGALLFRRRFVFCCWDPPGITVHNRRDCFSRLRAKLLKGLFACTVARAEMLVLNLHPGFLEGWFPERLRGKVFVFRNGTRCEANQSAAEGVRRVRGRIGVNGAFASSKGCWAIARIFLRLWQEDRGRSLVWIGGGAEREAVLGMLCRAGIPQEALIAPGVVPNAEAMRLLASCEVALNAYDDRPSWRWNYVLKIPEFLSLGLPVVSSATPGAQAYLSEASLGVCFTPGDETEAAAKVGATLGDAALPERSDRCRQAAQAVDWGVINAQIAAAIKTHAPINGEGATPDIPDAEM